METIFIDQIPVALHPVDKEWNFWIAKIGNTILVRHDPLNSSKRADSFIKGLEQFAPGTIRLSSIHLGHPENEWEQTTGEQILLAWLAHNRGLSFQAAHLNIPMQPLFGAPTLSEFRLKALDKLPKLQNSDGWETYCYWVHEEMERYLETFRLESMEVYTLQALFEDFVHEVRASLLLTLEAEVAEALLKQGAMRGLIPGREGGDLMSLEKGLIKRRGEAREELATQYGTLKQIVSVITAMDGATFKKIKSEASLLSHLLGGELDLSKELSWSEKLVPLQLLNSSLGLITAVSCDRDRTNVAFALLIAVEVLSQREAALSKLQECFVESVQKLSQLFPFSQPVQDLSSFIRNKS